MTRATRRQGQGRCTPQKQARFASIFDASLRLSMPRKGPAARYPYWHFDINAACGFNAAAGCDGSPLVFIDRAKHYGRRVNAYFCDNDPDAIRELRGRLAAAGCPAGSRVEALLMDNGDFLAEAAGIIADSGENPEFAFGSILCDPNGYKVGFPVGPLVDFATLFPRIDIFLSINSFLFSSVQGLKRKGRKGFESWPELKEVVHAFRDTRADWSVSNSPDFLTVVGRQRHLPPPPDFYPIHSDEGDYILTHCKQLPEQAVLF